MRQALTNRSVALAAGLFLAVCLTAWAGAESEAPQEADLLGILDPDMRVAVDPNTVAAVVAEVDPNEVIVTTVAAAVVSDPNNDLLLSTSPTTHVQRQLWAERISTTETVESQSKSELERLIQQLSSIEIQPRPVTSEAAVVEAVPESDPNTAAAGAEPAKEAETENLPKVPDSLVSAATLEQFKEAAQQADQLLNPLELAEVLFNGECLKEAAACYREALKRLDEKADDHGEDRAWICLQLGNCLKTDDPQAAMEYYQTVIVEFPTSPWVPLAKTKSELIRWHVADQPETLISASKKQMNDKGASSQ
jgi:tetratricopeptide (TPR) repeat protein